MQITPTSTSIQKALDAASLYESGRRASLPVLQDSSIVEIIITVWEHESKVVDNPTIFWNQKLLNAIRMRNVKFQEQSMKLIHAVCDKILQTRYHL